MAPPGSTVSRAVAVLGASRYTNQGGGPADGALYSAVIATPDSSTSAGQPPAAQRAAMVATVGASVTRLASPSTTRSNSYVATLIVQRGSWARFRPSRDCLPERGEKSSGEAGNRSAAQDLAGRIHASDSDPERPRAKGDGSVRYMTREPAPRRRSSTRWTLAWSRIPTAATSTSTGSQLTAREMDIAANRIAHGLGGARRRPRRSGRHADRELARAGDQLLRRAEARRDPGADQHRVQGRVPPPRPRRLRRACRGRPGQRCAERVADLCAGNGRPGSPSCARSSWSGRRRRTSPDSRRPIGRRSRPRAPTRRPRLRPSGPSDLACFIYTAGTTGPSKGCMLPHHYVVALAEQIARAWQRRPDDVVLTPLPLFHFNAISVCVVGTLHHRRQRGDRAQVLSVPLLAGGEADRRDHALDARARWRSWSRTRTTFPSRSVTGCASCAAAPMPPDTDRIWRERFGCATFSGGYGLTEASLISMLPAGAVEPGRRSRSAERRGVRSPSRGRRGPRGRRRRDRRDRVPADRTEPDVRGLLAPRRGDRRGDAQPLVPHR